ECTEHQAEIKDCRSCGQTCRAEFPADIKAPVQYGKNFRSLLSYLYDAQIGASRRIRQMSEEMFGFAVSEGTLQRARQEQYDALEPFEHRLEKILPQEALLHADETSVPINKLPHWVQVLCTPLLTFLSVQPSRGQEAMQAIGIIPRFVGWLMHDFLSSYASFENCLHTFCKSHLLRELVFLFEQHQQQWAKDLYDLLLDMLKCVKDRKARDAPLTSTEVNRWYQQYRKILRAGRQANPLTPEQTGKKRPKQSKEQNLLDRLAGCDECLLAFLWNFNLPFTNNEAERDFRSYETLRADLFDGAAIETLAQFDYHLFKERVDTAAFVLRREPDKGRREEQGGCLFRLVKELDSDGKRRSFEAALTALRNKQTHPLLFKCVQRDFDAIPGKPWTYWPSQAVRGAFRNCKPLKFIADPKMGTRNNRRFLRYWWEIGLRRICRNTASVK